ncbi:MAG: hypothetical protein ACK4GJ_05265 [bacterium]
MRYHQGYVWYILLDLGWSPQKAARWLGGAG